MIKQEKTKQKKNKTKKQQKQKTTKKKKKKNKKKKIVSNLIFISIKYFMLSWDEHEKKKVYNLGVRSIIFLFSFLYCHTAFNTSYIEENTFIQVLLSL